MNMKLFPKIIYFLIAIALVWVATGVAQNSGNANNANMEILAEKVKADKKLLVAMNMNLSDEEGTQFWPIYDAYQSDLDKLNQRSGRLIEEYAKHFNSGSISNQTAAKLLKEFLAIEAEELKVRVAMVKKMGKDFPAKRVARYVQIENKIRALIDFGLAEQIPLVY